MEDEFVEFEVGTIVVATGYDEFDPNIKPELGYGVYDNVITGLEMERLCSASGPDRGRDRGRRQGAEGRRLHPVRRLS